MKPPKPPASLHPWAPLPQGAAGDEAAAALEPIEGLFLARAPRRATAFGAAAGAPRGVAARSVLSGWVIAAWCCLALALASTGPSAWLLPFFAGLAGLLGLAGLVALRMAMRATHGRAGAVAAIVLAAALVLLDITGATRGPLALLFSHPSPPPGATMDLEARLAVAGRDMPLVAFAAAYTARIFGDATITTGANSIMGNLDPASPYAGASTLADNLKPQNALEADFIVFTSRRKLPDPFADDLRATYGVFITDEWVIVYSAGPDGAWQIDPRRPAPLDLAEPQAHFAAALHDPATGKGDLVWFGRRDELLLQDERAPLLAIQQLVD